MVSLTLAPNTFGAARDVARGASTVRLTQRQGKPPLAKGEWIMARSTNLSPRKTGWEHFPHDADLGLRGFGTTAAEAFEQAALALTAAITDAPVEARTEVEVQCEAPDLELLFVEWLNAIIYEMAVRHLLFGAFAVRIDDGRLYGKLWGEPVDVARHAPGCEPKGATYTALKVEQSPDSLWSAGCVVDV